MKGQTSFEQSSPPRREQVSQGTSEVEVSVIIPCYNAADTLGKQLESLAAQTWTGSWEVILADNGSTDNSVAVARAFEHRLPLHIVDAGAKRGQTYAYNRGVETSSGMFLLFCDADDVLDSGYVQAMVEGLREHPYVGGHTRHDELHPEWLRHARERTDEKVKEGGFTNSCHLPFVSGCTIGVRRSAFDRIGGFDETVFLCNDMDFTWRLAEHGIHPAYVPDAHLYYRARPTLWGNMVQEYKYARGFKRVHRLHGHSCYDEGKPLRYLLREGKRLMTEALKIRDRGDLLLWARSVAWAWGLACEAWVGASAASESDVSVDTVPASPSG